MTPHIGASAGDYAPSVLLPGDPQRAAFIAETLLDKVRCVNTIRGELGFTGLYRGRDVSVQATGMGRPSLSIYMHELVRAYGARTLIRIGTCGGLAADVPIRDVVIAQDAIMEQDLAAGKAPEHPDPTLLALALDQAAALGLSFQACALLCSDVYYHPQPAGRFDLPRQAGKRAVDMETAGLFSDARWLGVRALSICTVVDNTVTGEEIDPSERQGVFANMARLALAVAHASEQTD